MNTNTITQPTHLTDDAVRWSFLYKIAGATALLAVALIPLQIIVYAIWGIPDTAMH